MVSTDVFIAIISTLGTVTVAYIANARYRQNRPRAKDKPKIDSAFERLERLATRQEEELINKDRIISQKDGIIMKLSKENTDLRIEVVTLKKQRSAN